MSRRIASCCAPLLVALLGWCALALPTAATAQSSGTNKARILLLTGIDYPGHLWRQTAPVLASQVGQDKRMDVFTVEDPAFLDSSALKSYKAVILHFQNWEQPGPGERARQNLKNFVQDGGGLVLVHFACGAWHGEWPDFEKLAGRVWGGSGVRQHDPFGPFRVEIANPEHPITRGLHAFETRDELYTCLVGEHPIQVLAEAKSKVDGKNYPMAFVSSFGKGRTFHCVLGHDAQALSVPEVGELYRRACAWVAGLEPADGSKNQ